MTLLKPRLGGWQMPKLLLGRCSPRCDIIPVEEQNPHLPCDKLLLRYFFEYEAYRTLRKLFLDMKEYTHLVLATDDIVIRPEHVAQLKKDLEEKDYGVICGMMNVEQPEYMKPEGNLNICYELALKDRKNRGYNWISRSMLPKQDIFQVKFNGFALMCIKREIIEKTEFPCDGTWLPDGKTASGASVDLVFCWFCHENNIPIFTDKRIDMQHLRTEGRRKHGEVRKQAYFMKEGTDKTVEIRFTS